MLEIKDISILRSEVARLKAGGHRVGFVPTMGFLHRGHISLMETATVQGLKAIASIFVNPTQFNERRDFEAYPIDLDRDFRMLRDANVHAVFVPSAESMYGKDLSQIQSWVTVDRLSSDHEGQFRPGHFRGVSTVVAMLFNIVQPDCAVFGEKDFQQLRIIEQMVADLKFNIEIIRGKLVREEDGLAMSSRNVRLSPEGRKRSLVLSQALFTTQEKINSGHTDCALLCQEALELLKNTPLVKPEYVVIVDEKTLLPQTKVGPGSRMLVAAFVENVRLIDNVAL